MYKKLFVGGINHNTTISMSHSPPSPASLDDFIDYFSKFGPIENCNIVMDQETKKNRGFGFVIFSNPETANAVLQQSYHIINGKRVCSVAITAIFVGGSQAGHDTEGPGSCRLGLSQGPQRHVHEAVCPLGPSSPLVLPITP